MSAYVALCHDDRVELLTDGAQYDEAGTMRGFAEKVTRIASLPAAIATRGAVGPSGKLTAIVEKAFAVAGSFDMTMEALADNLVEFRAYDNLKGRAGIDGGDIEMVIAGISEERGPIVFFWSTRDDFAPGKGLKAYRLYDTQTGLGQSHVLRTDQADGFRRRGGLKAIGVELMEAMRRTQAMTISGLQFVVGGHVDLTTITVDGARTRRLHTWTDKIGAPITPFGDAQNVVPMTRQQRRAAEREARKRRVA